MKNNCFTLCLMVLAVCSSCSRQGPVSPAKDFSEARAVFVAIYKQDSRRWFVEEVLKSSENVPASLAGSEIDLDGFGEDVTKKPRRLMIVTEPIGANWSDAFRPRMELIVNNDEIVVYKMTLDEYRGKIAKMAVSETIKTTGPARGPTSNR